MKNKLTSEQIEEVMQIIRKYMHIAYIGPNLAAKTILDTNGLANIERELKK